MSQQLVITPQLQQAIKLLQLSRLELVEMVQGELMENPVLEEAAPEEEEEVPGEVGKEIESEEVTDKSHEAQNEVGAGNGELKEPKEFDWENYMGTYNAPGEEARSFNSEDLPTFENTITKTTTLAEHLEWQLHMANLTEEEEEIGATLISLMDDNGYLTTGVENIALQNGYSLEKTQNVLKVIQDFDPAGVGASDLKECLLLQTRFFGPERPLLETMITAYLPLLERRDYGAIARKMKIPLDTVVIMARIIGEMEPKPGRPFDTETTQYITPDVYVKKVGNEYIIILNEEGLPRLHISSFYKNMLSGNNNRNNGSNGADAKGFVEQKLKKAVWLIKSIHQRQRTIYRVAKCIVDTQQDFLERGMNFLRPMILKDVAEKIGVHESTVSRATSNKYIHTPQGLLELKFFFNSRVPSSEGDGVAAETVKEKIRRLVENENVRKPLSDKELADLLKAANINIARRTVAKYREMLSILPSSRRRQLY